MFYPNKMIATFEFAKTQKEGANMQEKYLVSLDINY